MARHAWNDDLLESVPDIPKEIIPGKTPTMRCCVYKERAILAERVKLAMGGPKNNPNVIHVIDIACDECPVGGYDGHGLLPRLSGPPLRGRLSAQRDYL